MHTIKTMLLITTTAAVLFTGAVHLEVSAHGGATGVVKERMDLMKSMGDQMKLMSDMVKGKVPFDAAAIAAGADEIQLQATQVINLFPDGSLQKVSEALPRIWEEREKFDALTEELRVEAGSLSQITASGDRRAIVKQIMRLGKTCSSCHTDYRKKQEE